MRRFTRPGCERRSARDRALASTVAIALWLPGPASAASRWLAQAEVQPEDAAAAAADPADIGELWRDAQTRMATSDYGGAIDVLTRLYETIATDPEAKPLRLRVRWALHQAHLGAHGVDGDARHLYVARDLLQRYVDELGEAEAEAPLRQQADEALSEVERRIAEHEASLPEPEPEPTPDPEPEPEPPPPSVAAPSTPDTDTFDDRRQGNGRNLIVAGGVMSGIGVVGLGMLAGGFASADAAVGRFETEPAQRDDARRAVKRGNAIGIAGAVVAGVGTIAGAVLLGLGLRQRRSSRASVAWTEGLTWRF